ncbi:MAG: acyltransferase [Candidatus Diapherotrites archaeon]|nr:acyltransferase [Candidatus Diapherotrites archaeon]
MRHIKIFKVSHPNSLSEWYKIVSPFKVIFNGGIVYVCRLLPSLALKRFLLRLTGMRIGKNVSIGFMAMFDVMFPELISISDNTVIGYNSTILAHEFLIKEYRLGKVEIGKNVMIGASSLVLPGVKISDGATISAMSLVNKDVPKNAFVGGVPAKKLK